MLDRTFPPASPVGARAPEFSLEGVRQGKQARFALRDFQGRWVILFFYPADFSFICPTEAVGFQRQYGTLRGLGCEVLGISVDGPDSHLAWTKELGGIDYPLLSDEGREVCRDYGVLDPASGRAARATFILDPEGVVRYCVVSHVDVGRSIEETVRVLKALQSGRQCPADWRPES